MNVNGRSRAVKAKRESIMPTSCLERKGWEGNRGVARYESFALSLRLLQEQYLCVPVTEVLCTIAHISTSGHDRIISSPAPTPGRSARNRSLFLAGTMSTEQNVLAQSRMTPSFVIAKLAEHCNTAEASPHTGLLNSVFLASITYRASCTALETGYEP